MQKVKPTKIYNKPETSSQIKQTSDYLWVEGREERQERFRGLKGTNCYV